MYYKRDIEIPKKNIENNLNKNDIELLEFNGEGDHIHLLIEAHPSMDLSKVINNIKTVSSRIVRKEFKNYLEKYYWKPYFWKKGHCIITTGGATIDIIKKYIEEQETPN